MTDGEDDRQWSMTDSGIYTDIYRQWKMTDSGNDRQWQE